MMAVKKSKTPRWYFSLRSPYSWFAYRELTESYPDVLDAVEWIPYWEPDAESERLLAEDGVQLPGTEMTRAKNFYVLQDTRRVARARGWTMTWPIDRAPVWEVSHLAYLVAEESGKGREFVDLAYKARWTESKNISDRAVIAEIAEKVGIDVDRAANAVDDPELRRRGVAELTRGYHDGAFGVPFFVHGFEKFWGTERLRGFVALVRGVPAEEVEGIPWLDTDFPELVKVGGDHGHAGGCG
jgi:2-hydroxychromene-2-carboxylate isomerase